METLKVNYILIGTGRTGGTRVILNFANELAKKGHEVSIVTGRDETSWFKINEGVKLHSLRRSTFDKYVAINYLNRHLKRYSVPHEARFLQQLGEIAPNSDLNISTYSTTSYVAYWKSSESLPMYHMQHLESMFTKNLDQSNFIKLSYFLPVYKIANSNWLAERYKELTGKHVDVLNAAVEHDVFYPRCAQNNESIDVVALGKGGWKNARLIYDAVSEVRKDLISTKPIILHYFGHLPPQGVAIDGYNTIFHKDISDIELAELYSKSYVQITSSEAESFPLPPLEAMACGTAVITTPAGTEDYARNMDNSVIVAPNDIRGLKEAISELIQDENLRNKLARNGILTARKFDYKRQTNRLETLISKYFSDYSEKNSA